MAGKEVCATVWRQHRPLLLEILVTMELNIQTPMHSHVDVNKTITTSIDHSQHYYFIRNTDGKNKCYNLEPGPTDNLETGSLSKLMNHLSL